MNFERGENKRIANEYVKHFFARSAFILRLTRKQFPINKRFYLPQTPKNTKNIVQKLNFVETNMP